MKTKNFHWHRSGVHFRDHYLLLDEHVEQIFAMSDDIREQAHKIGEPALRSIGDIARHQGLKDSDEESLGPKAMLTELVPTIGNCLGSYAWRTRYVKSTTMSPLPA